MERMQIVIDGSKFSTLEGFYTEIDNLLTKNLSWQTGHNLDAFNDLLRGGFGVHEYEQPLEIHWLHSEKSRKDLVYNATVSHWKEILTCCHPANRRHVAEKITAAQNHTGETLFDKIVKIILDTDNSGHDCILILDNES